jgi:hypothetical protein
MMGMRPPMMGPGPGEQRAPAAAVPVHASAPGTRVRCTGQLTGPGHTLPWHAVTHRRPAKLPPQQQRVLRRAACAAPLGHAR